MALEPQYAGRRRHGWPWRALCLSALVVTSGCDATADDAAHLTPTSARQVRVELPEDVAGARCMAVGTRVACWSDTGRCAAGCPVDVDMPAHAPARAYACGVGADGALVCRDRSELAGPFTCEKDRCTQAWPALPSADEWQCMERAGALHCRRTARAAGVVDAPVAQSYACGPRRGAEDELICVSFSPAVPDAAHTDCRIVYQRGGIRRICGVATGRRLGDACQGDDACPEGAACRSGACLPPRPQPDCWFDADCESGTCAFGSCNG